MTAQDKNILMDLISQQSENHTLLKVMAEDMREIKVNSDIDRKEMLVLIKEINKATDDKLDSVQESVEKRITECRQDIHDKFYDRETMHKLIHETKTECDLQRREEITNAIQRSAREIKTDINKSKAEAVQLVKRDILQQIKVVAIVTTFLGSVITFIYTYGQYILNFLGHKQ